MLQPQKKIFGAKIYPWILVLLPVLNQYQFGPLDLDVIVMSIFFLISLFVHRHIRISPVGRFVLVLIGYIFFTTVANVAFGHKFSPVSDIIIRSGKYIMYLLIVFFLGNESISYETLMKAYRIVAFAATIYVIIQAIFFYGIGITLPSKIGGSTKANDVPVGRLRAFYSEPAVMSYSLIPFIICSLFGAPYRKGNQKGNFDAIFVSVGIVLSTSGMGIIALAVVWAIWLFLQIITGSFKARHLLLLLTVSALTFVLYRTGILSYALERAGNTQDGSAISARASGYESLTLLTAMKLLIGAGFGNYVVENTFDLDIFFQYVNYSSIAEFLFTLGIFGTALWLIFFAGLFRNGTRCSRMLFLALAILAVFGAPLSAVQFPVWLTLICVLLPDGQFSRKKALTSEGD